MATVAICDLTTNLLFHKNAISVHFAHTRSVHFRLLITWLNWTGQVSINTGVDVREGTTVWYALIY